MKNQIVNDTVSSIMTQARVEERFRADFEKAVGAVYDAAEKNAAPVTESAALTHEEIAAARDVLRAIINRPAVGPV